MAIVEPDPAVLEDVNSKHSGTGPVKCFVLLCSLPGGCQG